MTSYSAIAAGMSRACNCIGPQNGQPLCPCMMRNVTMKDGLYVKVSDLGPVIPTWPPAETRDEKIERLQRELDELKRS